MFGLAVFQNDIVVYEISALEFLKNEFLPYSVDFGVGLIFSKSLTPAFSAGRYPGPGPDPFYKV